MLLVMSMIKDVKMAAAIKLLNNKSKNINIISSKRIKFNSIPENKRASKEWPLSAKQRNKKKIKIKS